METLGTPPGGWGGDGTPRECFVPVLDEPQLQGHRGQPGHRHVAPHEEHQHASKAGLPQLLGLSRGRGGPLVLGPSRWRGTQGPDFNGVGARDSGRSPPQSHRVTHNREPDPVTGRHTGVHSQKWRDTTE